jgi:hypothetical protein
MHFDDALHCGAVGSLRWIVDLRRYPDSLSLADNEARFACLQRPINYFAIGRSFAIAMKHRGLVQIHL